jgi:ketosteroid isomerase-like protein
MRNILRNSRGVLVLLGLLITVSAQAQAPKVDRAAEKATIERTFRDYAAMFLMGDIKKVTAYYAEPMMDLPSGRAMTRAEAEPIMERVRENRRSRGIVKEMLELVEVKIVGEGIALLSFINKRLTKDDAVVETSAGTYYLKKTDDGWKIAVLYIFPVADYVKLD